ncbi:MAG: hypothetical protein NC453_12025 [Muribaculum sp.]|nr:hypothetical protein [Muribaculum sp.]
MAVYRLLRPFSDIVFYSSLSIGLLIILTNIREVFNRETINRFKIFFIYILIMWLYQFMFGMDRIFPKTWTYLASKTVMLLMTVAVIDFYPKYYLKNYYRVICIVSAVLFIIGFFTYPYTPDGRMGLGFANPNTSGGLGAICFCFFYLTKDLGINKWVKRIILIVFIFAVLVSGSRASLGLILLAVLYKKGFSFKTILATGLIIVSIFVVLPQIGLSFQGIDRLLETIDSQNFSAGREEVRQAAWIMINNSPIEGNGIYCSQSEEASLISELGSHNAYLDFLKWFGYPLGGLLIASIFICAIELLKSYRKSILPEFRAHLLIIWGVLGMCFFEGLIWGVNEINNTLFFVSFGVLGYYKYTQYNSEQLIK